MADNFCLSNAMASILEVVAQQVLNLDSDSNSPEKTSKAASGYLREKICAVEVQLHDVWQGP